MLSLEDNVTLIVELRRSELRLIGQLLHIYLYEDSDKKPLGQKLMLDLMEQTDCVFAAAKDHGVWDKGSVPMIKSNMVKATPHLYYDPYGNDK